MANTTIEVYLRYSDGDEEIGDFTITFSSEIEIPTNINYNNLCIYLSYEGIYSEDYFISSIKNEVGKYSLKMNKCPQIWVTKINNINLKSLYQYNFDQDKNALIECAELLDKDLDTVEDYISDYFLQTVFSVENIY